VIARLKKGGREGGMVDATPTRMTVQTFRACGGPIRIVP